MYFFLRNLSYLDLCYSTVIAPKTLANVLSNEKKIPYRGCAVQFSSFALSVPTEGVLLAVMASGRFSAICSPLLYPGHVSPELCVQLVTGSYACGCINAAVQTGFTFSLRFRGLKQIGALFLWCPSPDQDLLCGHLCERGYTVYSFCSHHHHHRNCHSGFLCIDPLFCPKDPFNPRQE